MLLHLLSITNSCTQLKHFHNFHLKLYTLKMVVMRTKTYLKNPTCFDRFADHHQGLVHVPCTITTCQFFCLRIPVMWRYVFCMCVLAPCLLVWCLDVYWQYTSRHNTNKHGASTHIQKTYRHITGMRRSRKNWQVVIVQGTWTNPWWWSANRSKHVGFF